MFLDSMKILKRSIVWWGRGEGGEEVGFWATQKQPIAMPLNDE